MGLRTTNIENVEQMRKYITPLKIFTLVTLFLALAACSKKEDPKLRLEQDGNFELVISGDLETELSGEASFDQVIVSSSQPGTGGSTLSIFLEAGLDYSHSITLTKSESDGFGEDIYSYNNDNEVLNISMTFIDYEAVKTYTITSGSIEITSVRDDWIEGSFAGVFSEMIENTVNISGTFQAKGSTLIYAK